MGYKRIYLFSKTAYPHAPSSLGPVPSGLFGTLRVQFADVCSVTAYLEGTC